MLKRRGTDRIKDINICILCFGLRRYLSIAASARLRMARAGLLISSTTYGGRLSLKVLDDIPAAPSVAFS